MNQKINIEQSEYWNEKSGPKWVRFDDSMNERFSILTKKLIKEIIPEATMKLGNF